MEDENLNDITNISVNEAPVDSPVLDNESLLIDLNTNVEELVSNSQQIETLIISQNEILSSIYVSILFIIGIVVPAFVSILLYKFFKLFY